MNITTVEKLAIIWKSLTPKSYNIITRIIVSAGLGLMAIPSLIQVVCLYFFGKDFYLTIFGQSNILVGLIVVLIGLIYNIISQLIDAPKKPENSIKNSQISNSKIIQVQGDFYEGASSQDLQEIKEILKDNSPLKDEWFKQIQLYKNLLNEYKPKTALKLVEALETRLNDSNLSSNSILRSEIAYLKGLCLEMIKNRVTDAYKCFIIAYELNSIKDVVKERACISYYMTEEYDKAQVLVNDILSTNSLNEFANAINVLLKPDSIAEGMNSVSKIVSGNRDFNRIIHLNVRNKEQFNNLVTSHPQLIQDGVVLTLLESTHQNYKNNLYIAEVAITRFLREFKILFNTIDYDNNRLLISTHNLLDSFMKLLQNSEITEYYVQIDFFRVFTGYLISKDDAAVFELQRLYNQNNNNDELLSLILSNVLQQSDKIDEAIQILNGMSQETPNSISLLLYCHYRADDIESYATTANRRIKLLEKIDSLATEEILRMVGVLAVHDKAKDIDLDKLSNISVEVPQYFEFIKIYRDLYVSGPKEEYTEWLLANKDVILKSEISISHYLQDAFFLNKNFDECITIVELKEDQFLSAFEISNYIWALHYAKANNHKLLKWLKHWRNNLPYNSAFTKLEIQKRTLISDWGECLDICKYAISHDQDELFMLYLAISCFHLNSTDEIENYVKTLAKFNYQNAVTALQVANILLQFKFHKEGMELCYYWAKEKDNKQARTMFFMSFLKLPWDDFFVTFDEVEEGCYVFYKINGKDEGFVKIIEPNDEFSKQLLGHKTNDVIEIKRPLGNIVDSYKIGIICNKYLALKMEIIEETKNPQSGLGMQSFNIEEDGSPLDIIHQIAGLPNENPYNVYEEYYSQKILFSQLAFSTSELRENLIHVYYKLVYEKNGLLKMDPKAFPLLDFFQEYDFILDFTSLLHFYILEKEGKYTFKNKFKIPSFIMVLINSYRNEPLGMVHHEDYVLDKEYYDHLIAWINEKCEIINPASLLDIMDDATTGNTIENELGRYLINQAAMVQEFPNSVLITDDLFFYTMYPLSQKKLISTDVFLVYEMVKDIAIEFNVIDPSDNE